MNLGSSQRLTSQVGGFMFSISSLWEQFENWKKKEFVWYELYDAEIENLLAHEAYVKRMDDYFVKQLGLSRDV